MKLMKSKIRYKLMKSNNIFQWKKNMKVLPKPFCIAKIHTFPTGRYYIYNCK